MFQPIRALLPTKFVVCYQILYFTLDGITLVGDSYYENDVTDVVCVCGTSRA